MRALKITGLVALFLAAIVAANLTLTHWGPSAIIPNAFFLIGFDLVTRDRLADFWGTTRGDDRWHRRMEQAMNTVCGSGAPRTWLHMLRGLDLAGSHYPFASADSTNVAQNHSRNGGVRRMADEIDGRQCPARWNLVAEPMTLGGVAA